MTQDPMADIRASFFVECEELLESLQDALTEMEMTSEAGAQDSETINVVFRAVHSIKGGAGAFALEALVGFAHCYETVLDRLRSGGLELTPAVMKLFFRAADMLQDHVRAAQDNTPAPAGSDQIVRELEALTDGDTDEEEVIDFQPMALSFDFAPLSDEEEGAEEVQAFTITLTPQDDLYRSGNEPLMLLRALRDLGDCTITCDQDALPSLEHFNPEAAYLSWTVTLGGDVAEAEIREVFDFVEDVCTVEFHKSAQPATISDLPPAPEKVELPEDPPIIPAPAPAPKPPPAPATRMTAPHDNVSPTVRVDLERIDRLVNLVGELVINQAMLAQSVSQAGLASDSAVTSGLEAFMMLTRDIQDSVMMIRAQPVKPLFQRMARILREASAAIGKEVRLITEGDTTEVDKTVIERLADPLTHMIRNAIDHGLESPEKRLSAGKPAEGIVTLSAQHRAGRVLIELSDDGGGINRPRVRDIAISKGLISADAQLSDTEIDNLLFLPGFSTAKEVSALSGRGVGMDVVRSAIQALGGRISILSEPGQGTTFSISLPLTLAVLDGMVVKVDDQTLVVPLSAIVETATVSGADIKPLGPQNHVLNIRGSFVPIFDLGTELGYRADRRSYDNAIVLLTAQDDGKRAAIVVDAIMEQRQVVIKGLSQNYGHIPGVAAATILGDGQIALILDPTDLVQHKTGRTGGQDYAIAG